MGNKVDRPGNSAFKDIGCLVFKDCDSCTLKTCLEDLPKTNYGACLERLNVSAEAISRYLDSEVSRLAEFIGIDKSKVIALIPRK